MDENQLLKDSRDFRRLRYAPGNMTVYDLVAVRLDPPSPDGRWVVSCVNFGCCLEVWDGQYLSDGYLAEKLRPRTGTFGTGDITALRDGIEKLLTQ